MAGGQFSDRNERSPAIKPARAWFSQRLTAAAAAGLLAFVCYWHTLLPGLDFGDTASFQTGVGFATLTPRQAYPLYYALGNVVVWLDPREPAHAMNLASAIFGAAAAAVAVIVAAEISGALIGGVAAGLLLAFSYTFWTQAIIAEVYTLHLLIVGLCLLALLAWERKPTIGRLTIFYAIYAAGFGNHLSMILLLPGFAVFILMVRPRGSDDPLRPKVLALAVAVALLGASQYAWNFRGLWLSDTPPANVAEALGRFWFDVTKADWRQTLVMSVSDTGLQARPALYWFDLRQQVGIPGVLLAAGGFILLAVRRPRIGVLLALLYLVNLAFAWTYNVGDVHVFFLPSHYIVALCAGAGVAALAGAKPVGSVRLQANGPANPVDSVRLQADRPANPVGSVRLQADPHGPAEAGHYLDADGPAKAGHYLAAAVCLAYTLWRGYDTFPAVDRSWDHRPDQLLSQFVSPPRPPAVLPQDAIFGVDANWQIQNAFEYFMRERKPGVSWFTFDDLQWLNGSNVTSRFQHFSDGNLRAGRAIIVTPVFAERLRTRGYQGKFDDLGARDVSSNGFFAQQVSELRPLTTYALAVLRPYREYPLHPDELAAAWAVLTDGSTQFPQAGNYTIVVGQVGRAPAMMASRDRPFRVQATLAGAQLDVRMESWLPTDTIRRAGFGHVIVNRRHVLTLDRGVSFVALDALHQPSLVVYRSSLFSPLPRLVPWSGATPTGQ